MMTLTEADHGFTCVMKGVVTDAEADGYLAEARRLLPEHSPFMLLVDQRECKILNDAMQKKMEEIIGFFFSRGLERVAIICASSTLAMQMNRLASGTPAEKTQVAFDGKDAGWERSAKEWLTKGIRPANHVKA